VTEAEREGALATLPERGDVREFSSIQRRKLATIADVLKPHGRERVYVIKVIDLPQAAVALHGRAILLITRPALDLLEPQELQALAAHEVGHEYFWNEYYRARQDDDRALLRRLELVSDGIAILTLRRAGADPRRLTSAIRKVVEYNRDRLGAPRNEDRYPAIGERRTFAERLVEWLDCGSPACLAPPTPANQCQSP
jgi:predicted Zn-dependent protease